MASSAPATRLVPGVRLVRRPATAGSPAFDLAAVRVGPRRGTPVLVIPGGPGLGSVLAYRGFRRAAARAGLDVIMVEHRGVGLSRRDLRGSVLPAAAMRVVDVVDDLAAVLRAEGVRRAHVVGSSYGSYLASAFGVRHPELVAGTVLDSALQSATNIDAERVVVRGLFWDAGDAIAGDVRALVAHGEDQRVLLDVVRAAHELCGPTVVGPLLRQRIRGGRGPAWRALEAYATRGGGRLSRLPGVYEFDPAGTIGFRELDYGAPLDGLPFDPALTYSLLARRFPPFAGEDFRLPEQTPAFPWPTVVLTGSRDLRTPSAVAERVARTAQDGVLVPIENGHSALDTHPAALLAVVRALVLGRQRDLPARAAAVDGLPRRGAAARFAEALRLAVR